MKTLDRPIAVGRTAEVFAWEDGTVLKLYRDWCPPDWIEHEARIARAVDQAGLPAPKAGEILEVNGRRGIIYERVDGPSMLDNLAKSPFKLAEYGRMLAQLHLEMHRTRLTAPLPSGRGGMVWSINHAKALPDEDRTRILAVIEKLPDGNQLCHGDFHPGNVILSPRGPVVIDWMTAVQANPAGDVARTRLLLTVGDPPQGGVLRLIILLGRSLFVRSYVQTYAKSDPETMRLSQTYLPIVAAARLNEEITPEREKLLRIVRGAALH